MRYPAMGCGLSLALKLQRTSAVPSSLLTLLTRPESAGREGSSCPDFTSAALYFGVVLTTTLSSIAMPTLSGVINVPSGRIVPAEEIDNKRLLVYALSAKAPQVFARVLKLDVDSIGGAPPRRAPEARTRRRRMHTPWSSCAAFFAC